jgi:hypothetical protein
MPARRLQRDHVWRLLLLLAVAPIAGAAPIDSRAAAVLPLSPVTSAARSDEVRGDEPCIDGTASLGHCTITTLQDELRNLDDADPGIRARTRELLMTLPPDELPALREAVRQTVGQAGPLTPTQISLLRDVVCQIVSIPAPEATDAPDAQPQTPPVPAAPVPIAPGPFGQGPIGAGPVGAGGAVVMQNLPDPPDGGFLGVFLGGDDDLDAIQPNIGVTVQLRIPGYVGYRMLCDGDVIDSILVPGVDSAPRLLAARDSLHKAVSQLRPGSVAVLGVLRGGRHLQVTLVLDRKDAELNRAGNIVGLPGVPEFIQERLEKAQAAWDQQFAPLVDDVEPGTASARAE